ncbi:TetR/AcrR family transcriptional regulator [Methanofollis fontis]|uniref:HTH tetR-type domain-containing protein n=1 Tax=Methanofollis fontis TaxID=2052832 RepID=A0A483CRF7_9EURY|nr:TetR/AcrR family transcriptional regulator [Methanofollis fontis]TAJ45408.1 hypothetical protein CUJ86_01315 [Methanofollis fontis]
MSRPLSEEKRRALLEAALDLFAVQGVHATPTQQISRRAGVSEGTLFRYFRTKEDLVETVQASVLRSIADEVQGAIRPGTPVDEQIRAVKRRVLAWMFANPKQSLLFEQALTMPGTVENLRKRALLPIPGLDDLFGRAKARGLFPGVGREVFLAHFWYPNFMLVHLHALGGLQEEIEVVIDQAVRMMWSGLVAGRE